MGPAQTSPCTLRLDYWFSPDISLLCYTAPPTSSNVFKLRSSGVDLSG